MKKFWPVIILFLMILSACNKTPEWQISIELEPFYKEGAPAPFVINITENEKEATELTVVASFEMERMDHGTVEVKLKEKSAGVYEGLVELPMSGDYIVVLTIQNENQQKEELIEITVE